MSEWLLFYTSESKDDFQSLGDDFKKRVKDKINWLVENFDNITPLGLGGKWSGFFKLRV